MCKTKIAYFIFLSYNVSMEKLDFEFVPEECWYKNLRSFLQPSQWDKIRRAAYARAGGRCMICSAASSRLEAHEKWSYDEENGIQKLETVLAICRSCHEVIHYSRSALMGRGEFAMEHYMKVNNCSQSEFHIALAKANEIYQRRNKIEYWQTDLSWLKGRL